VRCSVDWTTYQLVERSYESTSLVLNRIASRDKGKPQSPFETGLTYCATAIRLPCLCSSNLGPATTPERAWCISFVVCFCCKQHRYVPRCIIGQSSATLIWRVLSRGFQWCRSTLVQRAHRQWLPFCVQEESDSPQRRFKQEARCILKQTRSVLSLPISNAAG
jgi:hypothetical protein